MTPTPDIDVLLPDEDAVRARRDALVDELRRPSTVPRLPIAPRRLVLLLALLLAASGGAAATGLFTADDVKVEAGVGCYASADLHTTISVMPATPDPVAACAEVWREGAIDGRTGFAPPLVACSGQDEPVRVMPSDDPNICARLGLLPLPADYPQATLRATTGAGTAP